MLSALTVAPSQRFRVYLIGGWIVVVIVWRSARKSRYWLRAELGGICLGALVITPCAQAEDVETGLITGVGPKFSTPSPS